ncbi:hypothetical protein Scep_025469 [Stephania cephalantha]|uniref:Uncharacterized protein n=1 Tax=Stephania cephalantha TaxID=152367 RepID=A0AAP0EIA1_9MAGN
MEGRGDLIERERERKLTTRGSVEVESIRKGSVESIHKRDLSESGGGNSFS